MHGNEPDRLYIPDGFREEKYRKLLNRGSPLEGQPAKVLFILAMMKGVTTKKERDLGPKKDGYVRTSYLSDEDRALIYSVVVQKTGSLDVLADKKRVFDIAERFAAGGIQLLIDDVFNETEASTFERRLELDVRARLEKIRPVDQPEDADEPGPSSQPG